MSIREAGGFPVNIDTKQARPLCVCVCVFTYMHICVSTHVDAGGQPQWYSSDALLLLIILRQDLLLAWILPSA